MTQIATDSCLLLVKAEAQRDSEVASVPVVNPGPGGPARRRRGVTVPASASGNFKLNLTMAASGCHWQAGPARGVTPSPTDSDSGLESLTLPVAGSPAACGGSVSDFFTGTASGSLSASGILPASASLSDATGTVTVHCQWHYSTSSSSLAACQ